MLISHFQQTFTEAGCDEAGRGCLAGPVFAAAVILPRDFYHPELNDSKQLAEGTRYSLRTFIEENALCFAVASVSEKEIDRINILNASFAAMHRAIRKLAIQPEFLIIDGNRFKKYPKIKHECIIQGDGKYFSIAAASVLAKTYRDDHMKRLHEEHPHYRWAENKGYATKAHRTAIEEHGSCNYHRKSFTLLREQFELEL